ncbi:MAG: S8 family serine peptidase [Oligoflexia bacterium]|nr:S8 family serine peptidase [Oligoflexia bacterium]
MKIKMKLKIMIVALFMATILNAISSDAYSNSKIYSVTDLNQIKNLQQFEIETQQKINSNKSIIDWTLMIEFKSKPSAENVQKIKKYFYSAEIELFDNIKSPYFERLYRLSFKGSLEFKNNVLQILKNAIGTNTMGTNTNNELNISTVEESYKIDAQSITPNDNNRNPLISDDSFTPYLWGLENREQIISKDLDDIHLEKIKGKIGADIGVKNIYTKLDSLIKNEVLVAVVDSGVDIDHPDLKDNIAKNLVECENGALPFRPTVDKDKNGYIGDCMGWNFVSTKKDGDERVYDDVGHGTHLAGIIAAKASNKLGVAGVALTSKIKIVPVKVLQKNEGPAGSAGGLATGGLSDRIAKGILYAVKRNVHVINLSMGWPISVDTKYLKMSIIEAQNRGIVIVAAAGNNNHSSPIFPCAYPNVICVGAIDAGGSFANFSNYGGHMDILAPGDNILSTYPQKLTPDFFSVKGYEIKNGTSQAAPYVAAAVGILIGINPQISYNEILARLLVSSIDLSNFSSSASASISSSTSNNIEKYSLYGLLNIEKSINVNKSSIVIPLLKRVEEIIVQSNTKNFTLTIPVKNLWAVSKDVKVKVELDREASSRGASFSSSEFSLGDLKEGEIKEFTLAGDIKNTDYDNVLSFTIKISSPSFAVTTKIFNHQVRIVSFIEKDPRFLEIVKEVIVNPAIKRPVAMRREDDVRTTLTTISDSYFQNPYPQYYIEQKNEVAPVTPGTPSTNNNNADKKIDVFIFKTTPFDNKGEFKSDLVLTIPNADSLLSVSFQDINYDGKLEYVLISIGKEGDEKFIQYSYFNQSGEATFKQYNHFRFVPEAAIVNYRKVNFIPFRSTLLNATLAIPFFFEDGKTPEKDLNKDPFEELPPEQNFKDSHFFYITPTKVKNKKLYFETRIVDNYQWRDIVKKKLGLEWNDLVEVVDVIPQSLSDFKRGMGKGIISVGKNYVRNYYLISFRPQYRESLSASDIVLEPLRTNGVHLEGSFIFPITNMDLNKMNAGAIFVGHETNTNVRMSIMDYENSINNIFSSLYSHPLQRDSVLSAFACYKNEGEYFTFLQTKSSLLLHRVNENGESFVNSRPITRFSFLPGSLYNEIFYPISISNPSRPALYVDATEINRKDLYILSIDENKNLISPIKLNVRVPSNCKSLNPSPIGEKAEWGLTLLCEENKKWFLHYLILD